MKINGKDLSEYGTQLKQWRIDHGERELKNNSEWVSGQVLPIFQPTLAGFMELTLTVMVHGDGREDIEAKISDLVAALLSPAELELDGWSRKFCGALDKYSREEENDTARLRWQTVKLTLSGYRHGDETSVSSEGASGITLTNPGNMPSPAVLILTPTIGAASISISGICRDSVSGEDLPVTVRELTTGQAVTLDGVTGLITETDSDGEVSLKTGDVDIWALPTLLPGENTVTFSSDGVNATLTVLPIYM